MQSQWAGERGSDFFDRLRASVHPAGWQNWLSRLEHDFEPPGHLRILAPSEFHLRWVLEKHRDAIEQAAAAAYGESVTITYEAGELDGDLEIPVHPATDQPAPAARIETTNRKLIPRYRFDTFVVGPSNRFSCAAAMAVAEQPASKWNPLFIYGGAGLGKTHLLNAVGHLALDLYPGLEVRSVSSESFFNDFIECIRRRRMDDFKSRYRTTDILLLDDVQFFEGKEQILEEFFHTFNSLYESGKQMVISSDRHPRHLSTLEDRLRSRFEWGLLTDIQPPDVETRIAILRKNAEFAARPVPHEVLELVAQMHSNNIRELEGALTRVTAYAALNDQDITMTLAQQVLGELTPQTDRPVPPDEIIRQTAQSYGFTPDDLAGPSRRQPLVLCRQVAMYLLREQTDLSLPRIGALFGGRDHSTVIHALEKVNGLLRTDHTVYDRVALLSQGLRKR